MYMHAGQDLQLAHQSQARWQPGCASIRSELSSPVYLPMTMEVCSALMRAITTYLLAVDAFAESDEDVAAAVAFAAQVLQIPLEYVKQSVAAGNVSPVKKMSASSEADVAKNPEVKDASTQTLHGSHQDNAQSSHGCTCYLHNGKTCAHMNLTSTSEQCSSMVKHGPLTTRPHMDIVCTRDPVDQARLMDRVQERQQVQAKKCRQR
jgi:hypothetical protein